MTFESLGLTPALCRALDGLGFTTPTPIQAEAIPAALEGRDLLAGAQTGTGKTAAFGLPLLQKLATGERTRNPRALILAPTRELAQQVHDNLRDYAKHLSLKMAVVYGGVSLVNQANTLRRGVDIIVACPGRLIDHMQQRNVDLREVQVLVLDEADRMLDIGFLPAIRRIIAMVPKQRQTMLFSATFDKAIREIAKEALRDPQEIQVNPPNAVATMVTHRVHPVRDTQKREVLLQLLSTHFQDQTLVFAKTKHGSDRLAKQITAAGIRAEAIHGNKSQNARLRALADFKSGAVRVLVATDIAARGLDIPALPRVINFELPMVPEDYVHRIGRTGRAGCTGEAVSLVSKDEAKLLRQVQRILKDPLEVRGLDGFPPDWSFRDGNDINDDSTAGQQRARRPDGPRPPRRDGQRPGGNAAAPRRDGHAHGPRRDGGRPQGHAGGPRRDGGNGGGGQRQGGQRRDGTRPA
ncbi:DEAD/DEAH box helicase [Silanimonas sp.]|jgi:ATP-dependent RNA helicase RhlE|uniref:DEAD/DEAH box helicase n=1 Tax=Silanimonas sp. TaxID=1929290 RepID=UPI0022C4D1DF|nr:DEAD/DEAH box helicase [Silanimonas sp.]MCZ8063524.1 DEAD/DEAH box helicase [Silanimonas sp.]